MQVNAKLEEKNKNLQNVSTSVDVVGVGGSDGMGSIVHEQKSRFGDLGNVFSLMTQVSGCGRITG